MQKYAFILLAFWAAITAGCSNNAANDQSPIRIAYDKVIVSGQIGLVLEKTDILKKHNLPNCQIKAVSESPDISLLCNFDIIITGEAGPMTLYEQGMDIDIVACLGYGGRVGLAVKPDSPVQSINELKGKSVYYLPRPATGRILSDWLAGEGLTNKDIKTMPLDSPGLVRKFISGSSGVDAAVLWDPMMEVFARNKQIRILKERLYWQGMAMKKKFIAEQNQQAVDFMAAFKEAFWYWLSHRNEVNQWYSEQENIPVDIIDLTSRANLNYRDAMGIKDIVLEPDQADYLKALSRDAKYQYENGFAGHLISPRDIINAKIMEQAR